MSHEDVELEFAKLLMRHDEPGIWLHRHPREALRAWRLLANIDVLTCWVSDSREGLMIQRVLRPASVVRSTRLDQATSVLLLPATPGSYNLGSARATQRRKARTATKLGVTWRLITNPAERTSLLAYANAFHKKDLDNADLFEVDLWIAAFVDNVPVTLTVIPADGEWSTLRYFRSLADNEAASAARYLMTEVVAEELGRRGVRYLTDTVSPFRLSSGLRHFSRMVGFRTYRVRYAR